MELGAEKWNLKKKYIRQYYVLSRRGYDKPSHIAYFSLFQYSTDGMLVNILPIIVKGSIIILYRYSMFWNVILQKCF